MKNLIVVSLVLCFVFMAPSANAQLRSYFLGVGVTADMDTLGNAQARPSVEGLLFFGQREDKFLFGLQGLWLPENFDLQFRIADNIGGGGYHGLGGWFVGLLFGPNAKKGRLTVNGLGFVGYVTQRVFVSGGVGLQYLSYLHNSDGVPIEGTNDVKPQVQLDIKVAPFVRK